MLGGKTSTALRIGLCHTTINFRNHGNRCLRSGYPTLLKFTSSMLHPWSMSALDQKRSLFSLGASWNSGEKRCEGLMKQSDERLCLGSHFKRSLSGSTWRRRPRGTLMVDMMRDQKQTATAREDSTYDEEDLVDGNVSGEERASTEEERASTEEAIPEDADEGDPKMLHNPVMLKEVLDFIEPKDHQVFLDMTFGAGGHTEAILQQCSACRVIALDRDPVAYDLALAMADRYGYDRVTPLLGRFSEVSTLLQKNNISPGSIDGVLIDAGCSSMQFDSAERGFAISKDGPLDMRMDGNRLANQPTAADVINSIDAHTLANIISTYGEEHKAKKIAKNITQYREKYGQIKTTKELKTIISFAFTHREANRQLDGIGRHSHIATRTFMALRIFVNNELHELSAGLKQIEPFVVTGGKLAALSFHSMEDRIVKRFMQGRDVAEKAKTLRQKIANRDDEDQEKESSKDCLWKLSKDLILPSEDEIARNPRSRSAKLRTAIKCGDNV